MRPMNNLLSKYTKDFVLTGDLRKDIECFFVQNNELKTLKHTLEVADEAKRVAEIYDIDPAKVIVAALMHDVSNVIPISTMLDFARELSIDVLDEELNYNRSVHQKLSKYMARDIFGIDDDEILNAIESHTTHKPKANMIDKILFVSDKISWNLPGEHHYLEEMRTKVYDCEIDSAILIYLNHIWSQRHKLKLVHPWLIEARDELMHQI